MSPNSQRESAGREGIGGGACVSRHATRVVDLEEAGALESVVGFLRAGDPVALPTETVYGLAADALDARAAARIFAVKERPAFDPLIVHLPDRDWLERLADLSGCREMVESLVGSFWPGPLTLVLPKRDVVPGIVTAGLPTVALRMSGHPGFRRVIEAFARPLAAPSANRFGRISPTCARHVIEELSGRIPLVVDGGAARHGIESTIIKPGADGELMVLRPGPVSAAELGRFGRVVAPEVSEAVAPGMLESHYAPDSPLVLVARGRIPGWASPERALLAWRDAEGVADGFGRVEVLAPGGDAVAGAARLFECMRSLDADPRVRGIVAERAPEEGVGVAINDRLRRAAAGGGK